MTAQRGPLPVSFGDFVPELIDRLQRVTDAYLEDFNEHQAFVYLIAELFETTDESRFSYTDGAGDGGIDFFVQDIQSYSVYQCKCPTLETLEDCQRAPAFDAEVVRQIVGAVRFLVDEKGTYDLKPEILRLQTDFQRDYVTDPESTHLTASIAILGDLTPAAQSVLEAEKQALSDDGIVLKVVSWTDVYEALHQMDRPGDIDFHIDLYFDDAERDLLRQNQYCYMLAHGADFYEAWRKQGWNLFDWNVRLQLHRSPVNRRIIASLHRARDRKDFHHLNNGVLITCRHFTIDETRKRVRVHGPQIINGCQTVCAIRDAYEDLSPFDQRHFEDNVRVQVKIIKNTEPEFIGRIAITTNDQNAMNPRNLKSNTNEQKDLQKRFRAMQHGWFYERKDGEWESLVAAGSRVRWFRKSDYAVKGRKGRRRYRVLDNEDLADSWYAWTGHSHLALKGGVGYFESDDVYNRVFRSRPNGSFWEDFGSRSYFKPEREHFDPGIPSAYQYLLAAAAAEFVGAKRVGWRANKREALRRGLENGNLRGDPETDRVTSSKVEVDEYLRQDPEYRLNIILNNLSDVLVELFAFLLTRRYGDLGPARSRALLQIPEIEAFCNSDFASDTIPQERQHGESLLGPTYAFLRYCIKQYYFENKAEINAAARLRSYLWRRRTVQRLREKVLREDEAILDWGTLWKKRGVTFSASLPSIE